MKKTTLRILLAGMIIAGLTTVCLRPEASPSDQAWKRLKKMRIPAGIMIGKGRPNYTEAYVHLTEIRALLEEAGIMETVTILLFTDYGTKIFLGTYAPVITATTEGGQKITFPTIPNAFLVTKALSYQVGDLYPFQFLNSDGKVKATLRTRLMGRIDQTF